jgi:hypothetical protein
MSDTRPAPIQKKTNPSPKIKAGRSLWLASFAAGVTALLFIIFDQERRMEPLRQIVTDLAPDRDAGTLDAVVALVFWGSLGGIALVILIQMLLLWVVMRRHGWARWALVVVLLVHAGATLLADSFLAAPGDALHIRLLLVAQLALAFVATVIMVLPGTGAWFRAEDKTGRGAGT